MIAGQMATRTESPHAATKTYSTPNSARSMNPRVVPVSASSLTMSAPPSGEPMDVSSPGGASASGYSHGPSQGSNHGPSHSLGSQNQDQELSRGQAGDLNGKDGDRSKNSPPPEHGSSSSISAPPPAAAAVHQPKIVQTAFIHKLYNMLEDPNIQHLISWSSSAESFIMSPSADFSKVLSQYFKHTNISSFVRQLNMYGFHKERDVFHTGSPDTTLWEFKHGNGNFKRGDLAGLREIKRRASRHALVHRENNFPKQTASQPGTPSEPLQMPPETTEARLQNMEHAMYDMGARLQRTEENAHVMHVKNQGLTDSMSRLLQINQELSRTVLALVPPESPLHRDVLAIQGDLQRQADAIRSFDEPQEPPYGPRAQYLGNLDHGPVSPRQLAQDDSRRSTLAVPQPRGQSYYRPQVPSSLAANARRPYGSIGSGAAPQSSPLRNAAPPPPPGPHPLSNVETAGMNMGRRHTSADIRAHGWQPGASPLPGPYPTSPGRVPAEDQRLRESLSTFSLQAASQSHPRSRPSTPPPPTFSNGGGPPSDAFGSWSWSSAANRDKPPLAVMDSSAPATRRGSMAHILNPTDTAERSDEDDDLRGDDDRKRKRMQ